MDFPIVSITIGVLAILTALVLVILFIRKENQRKRDDQRAQRFKPEPFPSAPQTPPRRKTPDNLGYNDLVVIGGVAHTVKGALLLNEDGFTWKEFWLDTPGSKVWLSVERDPELEVVQWTEIETDLEPGQKKLTYNGTTYSLDEKGAGTYEALGTTGLPAKGRVEYFDYAGPNDELLSFERFDGDDWEASEGFVLLEGMYELHPGRTSV